MAWTVRICGAQQDSARRFVLVEYLHESGACVSRELFRFNRDTPLADIRATVIERGVQLRSEVIDALIGQEVTF